MCEREYGIVKFWSRHGWGTISRTGKPDLFFDQAGVGGDYLPAPGDAISFTVTRGGRRQRATNMRQVPQFGR